MLIEWLISFFIISLLFIKLSHLINFLEIKHGEKDTLIPLKYAEELHQCAKQASIPVVLNKVKGAGHNDVF